jgi:hypothetical protein
MSNKTPKPNDQRSDVKNPNNPAKEKDQANQQRQKEHAPQNPPKKK